MSSVVDDRQRRVRVKPARLARAADRALRAMGRSGGWVDILLVDDRRIRTLNAALRGVSLPTDVLAFPLETAEAVGGLIGQVVISTATAARQARRVGVPVAAELDLLVTHGVL